MKRAKELFFKAKCSLEARLPDLIVSIIASVTASLIAALIIRALF